MKRLFLSVAISALPGIAFAADRVALVIGNDAYQHARKLNAAVNDASAVANSLKKLDFKVIPVTDAGVEDMHDAVDRLKKMAQGADSILIYYAGHGIESGGVNYLVPIDAKLEREIQLKTQAVSLDGILEELAGVNVPAKIVILDCCRDNPLEGRSWLQTRSSGGGLAGLDQENLGEATLVVYSASPGKPALDRVENTDPHSPFTSALLEQLPKPGIHSFEMFGLVEDSVIRRTHGRQAPRLFYNGSTQPFRNFRFAAGETAGNPPEPEVSPSPPSAPEETSPPDTSPAMPALPGSGFFNLNDLYQGGPYASYNSYSRTQILRRVQEKLKESGHYTSTVDGSPGPGTQRAIIAWQQSKGVEVSGKLDQATLQSLSLQGIGPMDAPKPTRASKPSSNRRTIEDILFD